MYALYQHYGFDRGDIGRLFIAGFGSSMIFGTIVGSLADKTCVLPHMWSVWELEELQETSKQESSELPLLWGVPILGLLRPTANYEISPRTTLQEKLP